MAENDAEFTGGGLDVHVGQATVVSSIFNGNRPNQISGNAVVSYSNVEGGIAGTGNVDGDPGFVNGKGRNFRLLPGSICIDAGDNASAAGQVYDLDRQPRFVDDPASGGLSAEPPVDIGAFEFPQGSLLRFQADSSTLTWFPVGGAVFYSMYRGDLTDLVDGDGDGLPDSGYGACVNDLDPDSTDTVFVDPEIPDPQAGLYYLFSVVEQSGRELHLGSTSAGQPRSVVVPCP